MVKDNSSKTKNRSSSQEMEDSTDSLLDEADVDSPIKLHKHSKETFQKFHDGLKSKDAKVALKTCQQLSSHLSSNGTNGLGQERNIHSLMRLAIDVPNDAGIECAYQLSEYVGGQECEEFLKDIFCSVGTMDPPNGTFKNARSQIHCHMKYAHFLRSIESKLQPDKSSMMAIWFKLLKDPNLYQATILSVLNQLEFVSQMSQSEVVDFLRKLTEFLLTFGKMKLKRKKTIAHKLARSFRLIIGSIFMDEQIEKNEQLTNQLVLLAKACVGKVRQPWISLPEEASSDIEDDIYGSDGNEGDDAADGDVAESSKNRLLFSNINVYEGCLHEIFRSIRCSRTDLKNHSEDDFSDSKYDYLMVELVESNVDFIKSRIDVCCQETAKSACAERMAECDCNIDLLTEACAGTLIEFYAIRHPEKAYDHATAIQAYVEAHHKPRFLLAVARLYPYRGNNFKNLFEKLFLFGQQNCSNELLILIEAAALYDRDTVQAEHIDFVDKLLMQAHDSEVIAATLKVLTTAAETNPGELMQERGEGYYGVVSRISSKEDNTKAIMEIDRILQLIAMSDRSEAVRIMELYKINLERHPNDILRCILYISMFQTDVVESHRAWIEECSKKKETQEEAKKILEVLKGKMTGETKNPKSSSFCSIQ